MLCPRVPGDGRYTAQPILISTRSTGMERVKHNRGTDSIISFDVVSTAENTDFFLAVRYSSNEKNWEG